MTLEFKYVYWKKSQETDEITVIKQVPHQNTSHTVSKSGPK